MKTYNLLILILLILSSCSFDKRSGIWKEEEKKGKKYKLISLVEKEVSFEKNFNANLKINLKKEVVNLNDWKFDGQNNFNLISHLSFKKKFNDYKKIRLKSHNNSSIVVFKDNLITADSKGNIYRFDNNKNILWKKNYYSRKEKKRLDKVSLAVDDDQIYLFDNLGRLYSVKFDSGDLNWTRQYENNFTSQIKPYKKKLFVLDSNNELICFSSIDGTIKWRVNTEKNFILTDKLNSIVLDKNTLTFINSMGTVTNININDGELLWSIPTQDTLTPNITNFLVNSDLVKLSNNLYFSNNFSQIFSINYQTGLINWQQNIKSTLRPIIINDFLFSLSDDGYLYVVDLLSGSIVRSNYLLDRFKPKLKKKIKFTGFLIASGKIIMTTNIGLLIIFKIENVSIEKILKLSNKKLFAPILANNNLYIQSENIIFVF